MASVSDKKHYDKFATDYVRVEDLPHVKLESELIAKALGDCTGLKVLDLGGGNGLHARRALDHGARVVDVVDISAEMMQIGKDIEAQLQRNPDKIHWHLADITEPLASQLPGFAAGTYNVVMANWVFDDSTDIADLEAMWSNVSDALAPNGKVIATRVANVFSKHVREGKYGYVASESEKLAGGGIKYKVTAMTTPPFSFIGKAVEDSYAGKDQVPGKFGIRLRTQDPRDTDIVRNDPDYWHDFVEDPSAVVVTGRRA